VRDADGPVPRFRFAALAFAVVAATAAAQDDARPPPDDAIRYRLVVDGPNPPADALRTGLDLAR